MSVVASCVFGKSDQEVRCLPSIWVKGEEDLRSRSIEGERLTGGSSFAGREGGDAGDLVCGGGRLRRSYWRSGNSLAVSQGPT